MFVKKKQPPIKSMVAHPSRIEFYYIFSEVLRVDGEVVGDIRANPDRPSILVISESASVTGVIQADHVIINGRVVGPVHAHELLELQPKANIEGDVSYKGLEMHQGALIAGRLIPLVGAGEKPTLQLAANND